MLTGEKLLNKHNELTKKGMTEDQVIEACGYFTPSPQPGGRLKLQKLAFYRALTCATGAPVAHKAGGGGRQLLWNAIVQRSGALLLGAAYLRHAGGAPGDVYDITIEGTKIVLSPVESKEADDELGDLL